MKNTIQRPANAIVAHQLGQINPLKPPCGTITKAYVSCSKSHQSNQARNSLNRALKCRGRAEMDTFPTTWAIYSEQHASNVKHLGEEK